jgi:hypothetical protein
MKTFFDKFENLKGVSFISINGYKSITTGEIANHVINVNLSVKNAKETDLERLKNCNDNDIKQISFNSNIAIDICKIALEEMLTSAEKNLSENKEERSNQSKAQTDSYFFLTPAIRLHKETMQVHVFGQAISKKVIVPGEYKKVNSNDKTLAKNAIKKHLDLRADKFRDFVLGNVDSIKINGDNLILI